MGRILQRQCYLPSETENCIIVHVRLFESEHKGRTFGKQPELISVNLPYPSSSIVKSDILLVVSTYEQQSLSSIPDAKMNCTILYFSVDELRVFYFMRLLKSL